jgi:AcrR family transcriptional regulator
VIKSSDQKTRTRPGSTGRSRVTSRPLGHPRRAGDRTRRRIIAAALETLRTDGFAGTSARAIARTGGINPALIFYHFGGVNELLLAALDSTSANRMARYRGALDGVGSLRELFEVMEVLYAEDMQSAHITAVQELVAGSAFSSDLGPEIARRMDPWFDFAEEVIDRLVAGSPLVTVISARDIAFAIVAMYMGLETVTRLRGDPSRNQMLFATARRLAPLLDQMVGGAKPRARGTRPSRVAIT